MPPPNTPDLPTPQSLPTTDVLDHQGNPRAADAPPPVAPPPPEVGPVLSIDTSPRRRLGRGGPWVVALTIVVVPLVLIPLSALTFALAPGGHDHVRRRGEPPPPPASAVGPVVAGVIDVGVVVGVAWLLVRLFRRSPSTTYVGADGVALFRGDRQGNVRQAQVLRFADAAELFTGSTRHFYNGIYTGTSYAYRFEGDGRTLFKVAGKHNSKAGTPKPGDAYHFARAAEVAWSNHFLDRCQAELARQKFIQFRVNGADYVRVGHGVMEFHFGSRTERIAADQVATTRLKDGAFHIAARDAKWFSRAGKFGFPYAKMANARVFILAAQRVGGLTFS